MIRVFLFSLILLLPAITFAQSMDTFQQIPFWNKQADSSSYIQALYTMAISVAAILVVLRLIMAGVQYMFSEMITSKQKAKETIQSALLGLLIILGAVTILTTINPNLVKLDVVGEGAPITVQGGRTSTTQTQTEFKFGVGDTWTEREIITRCNTSAGVDSKCKEESIDLLKTSCTNANGTFGFKKNDGFFSWLSTGTNNDITPADTIYACTKS